MRRAALAAALALLLATAACGKGRAEPVAPEANWPDAAALEPPPPAPADAGPLR